MQRASHEDLCPSLRYALGRTGAVGVRAPCRVPPRACERWGVRPPAGSRRELASGGGCGPLQGPAASVRAGGAAPRAGPRRGLGGVGGGAPLGGPAASVRAVGGAAPCRVPPRACERWG